MTQILPRFYRRRRQRTDPECSVDVSGFFPRIDISEPLHEICNRLGLAYHEVAAVTITPTKISAEVYLLNDDGLKYLIDDKAVVEVKTFEVST